MKHIDPFEIEKKYLDKLRDSGLFVSHPIKAYGGGVWIVKPAALAGHHIPEFSKSSP